MKQASKIRKFKRSDITLLQLLQENARMTKEELGARTDTCGNTCDRRMQNWKATGLIKGYRALIDYKKVGFDIMSFVTVSFSKDAGYDASRFETFEKVIIDQPHVIGCWMVKGDLTYILCVVAENNDDLISLLKILENIPVKHTHITMDIVKEVKHMEPIPLDILEKGNKTYLQILDSRVR